MGKLHIKNATTADIPQIRELTMLVWPQTYTPIIGETQVAYMLHKFYDPAALAKQIEDLNYSFIICYNDQLPVAFASWSEVAPQVYKLHKLYIIPQAQGNGIGRFMIKHIIASLQEKNVLSLRLNVNRYNYPAKTFYEKEGFHHLMDEDIDIGNGYFMNDHVLELNIPL